MPQHSELPQMAARLRLESRMVVLRLMGGIVCWALSMALLVAAVNSGAPGELHLGLFVSCLLLIVVGVAVASSPPRRALEAWKDQPDPAMIGPLLDALGPAHADTARQIQTLLTTLLPRLRREDALALTPRQRSRLREALMLGDADCNPAYIQAVVQALAQCADEQALDCLRQMARRGAITDRQQWVLDMILRCLPDVEAQVAALQSGANLLRASMPAPDPAQLLRAAQSAPDAAPYTLLRPDNHHE